MKDTLICDDLLVDVDLKKIKLMKPKDCVSQRGKVYAFSMKFNVNEMKEYIANALKNDCDDAERG